jgi:acyl carrier protein
MLEEIMDLEENTLQESTVLKQITRWDSIAKVLLMANVEEQFKKLLTAKELNSFKTPAGILDYIDGGH